MYSFHTFRGCDTNAFDHRGKLTPKKTLDAHPEFQSSLRDRPFDSCAWGKPYCVDIICSTLLGFPAGALKPLVLLTRASRAPAVKTL